MGKLREHHYQAEVVRTGNQGTRTSGYGAYSRNHEVRLAGKAEPLSMSSDAGIAVTAYVDRAVGTMRENPEGSGEFTGVALRPEVRQLSGLRREVVKTL